MITSRFKELKESKYFSIILDACIWISGFFICFGSLTLLAEYLINNSGYVASRGPVYRNILFASFVFSIFYLAFSKKRKDLRIFSEYEYIIMATISTLILVIFRYEAISYFKYLSEFALFIALYKLILKNLALLDCKKTKIALLLAAVLVSLFPIYFGNNLNSESFLQPKLLNEVLPLQLTKFEFKTTEQVAEIVSRNDELLSGNGFYKTPHGYSINADDSLIVTANVGPDLSFACLFLDERSSIVLECDRNLGVSNNSPSLHKLNYIRTLDFPTYDIKNNIINVVESTISHKSANAPLAELMLVRGYIFHHYNAILQGLRGSFQDAVSNQYGLGPLSIVEAIHKISKLSEFDSLYLSIYIINLIVLLCLILNIGLNPIVLIGYVFSVFIVIEYSAILAPLLYFARALPQIIILILIANNNSNKKHFNIMLCSLFFVSGMYNREYALLSIFALIFTVICGRRDFLKYLYFAIPGLLLSLLYSFGQESNGANIPALLLGVGFGSIANHDLILWVSILIAGSLLIYFNKTSKPSTATLYSFALALLFSVKYITNPSPNHLGFTSLVFSIFIYNACNDNLKFTRYLSACFILILMLISSLGVKNILYQKYNNDLNVKYEINSISSIFLMDSGLKRNAEEIRSYISPGLCAISLHDDFLSLYYNRNLTTRMPNLSTNINSIVDYNRVSKELSDCESFVIDKSLVLDGDNNYVIDSLYNYNYRLNMFISGYLHSRNGLSKLSKEIFSQFQRCSETESYYYCH